MTKTSWCDETEPPWLRNDKPVVQYGLWEDGWDWLVIAHESPGKVVSVQFHPPSKRFPTHRWPDMSLPLHALPSSHKPAVKELEPA